MSEDEAEKKIALLALGNQIEEVDVGLDFPVKIKPLTWAQEMRVAAVIGDMIKKGTPQEVADREYMKLTVLAGLVDPKLEEADVQNLKIGVVVALSREIGALSGGIQKK